MVTNGEKRNGIFAEWKASSEALCNPFLFALPTRFARDVLAHFFRNGNVHYCAV